MLEIKHLGIEVDSRFLIQDLNLTLQKHDKLAIIGEEGNGKSTLLKCLIGDCPYANISGIINSHGLQMGYFKQELSATELQMRVDAYLFPTMDDYSAKIGLCYQQLGKLELRESILEVEKIATLSGGEKVKLQLLKLQLEDPDILLLDEPTNDLDLSTLVWLEQFINRFEKPLLYVSHDETLLRHTANMILHLEMTKKKQVAKHTLVRMDYDTYVAEREQLLTKMTMVAKKERSEMEKKTTKMKQILNKVAYEQEHISRKNPHGAKMLKRKMKHMKVQERRLQEVVLTEIPDYEEAIHFFFDEIHVVPTKTIIQLQLDQLKIHDQILSQNVNLEVRGPEHVVIIGKNGVGKSTLLTSIYQELQKRPDLQVGYMPQSYDLILADYPNAIAFLTMTGDQEEEQHIRQCLGNMKFTSAEMTGDIQALSGGTKAKLWLLKLVLMKCNVLLLDEPTRNVSPLSSPVIRKVLAQYQGTIISISHDRNYIDEVCSVVYELTPTGLVRQKESRI